MAAVTRMWRPAPSRVFTPAWARPDAVVRAGATGPLSSTRIRTQGGPGVTEAVRMRALVRVRMARAGSYGSTRLVPPTVVTGRASGRSAVVRGANTTTERTSSLSPFSSTALAFGAGRSAGRSGL